MNANEMTLRLSVEETNLILESLGQLPFVKVYPLIGKIQEQARQQLGANGTPAHPDAAVLEAQGDA